MFLRWWFFLLKKQIQISEGNWPSRTHWAEVGQRYNVTYQNVSVEANYSLEAELELLKGVRMEINQTDLDMVRQHVYDNFLQVYFCLQISN